MYLPMTVLKEIERDGFKATVYQTDGGTAEATVHAEKNPAGHVLVLQTPLRTEKFRELRGATEGVSTSARVYGILSDAVADTEYRDRLP